MDLQTSFTGSVIIPDQYSCIEDSLFSSAYYYRNTNPEDWHNLEVHTCIAGDELSLALFNRIARKIIINGYPIDQLASIRFPALVNNIAHGTVSFAIKNPNPKMEPLTPLLDKDIQNGQNIAFFAGWNLYNSIQIANQQLHTTRQEDTPSPDPLLSELLLEEFSQIGLRKFQPERLITSHRDLESQRYVIGVANNPFRCSLQGAVDYYIDALLNPNKPAPQPNTPPPAKRGILNIFH